MQVPTRYTVKYTSDYLYPSDEKKYAVLFNIPYLKDGVHHIKIGYNIMFTGEDEFQREIYENDVALGEIYDFYSVEGATIKMYINYNPSSGKYLCNLMHTGTAMQGRTLLNLASLSIDNIEYEIVY